MESFEDFFQPLRESSSETLPSQLLSPSLWQSFLEGPSAAFQILHSVFHQHCGATIQAIFLTEGSQLHHWLGDTPLPVDLQPLAHQSLKSLEVQKEKGHLFLPLLFPLLSTRPFGLVWALVDDQLLCESPERTASALGWLTWLLGIWHAFSKCPHTNLPSRTLLELLFQYPKFAPPLKGFALIEPTEPFTSSASFLEKLHQLFQSSGALFRYTDRCFALLLWEGTEAQWKQALKRLARQHSLSAGLVLIPQGQTGYQTKLYARQALEWAKEQGLPVATTSQLPPSQAELWTGEFFLEEPDLIQALWHTLEEVNSIRSLDQLLPVIVDRVVELSQGDQGLLLTPAKKGWQVVVARSRQKKSLPPTEVSFSKSIVERAYRQCRAICVQDVQQNLEHESILASPSVFQLNLQAVLAIPLVWQQKCHGILYLDSHSTNPRFSEDWLPIFQALGSQMALAMENTQREEELARLNSQLQIQVEEQAVELEQVRHELSTLKERQGFGKLVGKSPKMQEVYHLIEQVAPTDVSVLIIGESGTGKELIAQAIHDHSPRHKGPLISENCAAVAEQLLESELFGHAKGAFTGATTDRKGLFELAHGGTLFLDEVGEMSLTMQSKLLRALQEREIRRLGDTKTIPIDVRILAATNRDLEKMVQKGTFRADLYYRLRVVTIHVPPLRERAEDIFLLIEHFLCRHGNFSPEESRQLVATIPPSIRKLLLSHPWPGNVRELENEVLRLLALGGQKPEWSLLEHSLKSSSRAPAAKRIRPLEELEREAILEALQVTGGNKQKAAKLLGISRKTLYNKLRQYNLL